MHWSNNLVDTKRQNLDEIWMCVRVFGSATEGEYLSWYFNLVKYLHT